MSNSCLRTKLKASVNNDSLKTLGSLYIELTNISEATRLQLLVFEPWSATIHGNGHFTNAAGTSDEGQTVFFKTKEYVPAIAAEVYVGNMYLIDCHEGDVLEITNRYAIHTIAGQGNICNIAKPDTTFRFDWLASLVKLNLFNTTSYINVDLSKVLKYSKNVESAFLPYKYNCTGSVEEIVENLLSCGRNSGTLTLDIKFTRVTLNGAEYFYNNNASTVTVTFNSSTSVTVSMGGNTIASYSGGTWSYS